MKGVVVAGVASGVGKTTVTAAIMGALTARGYKVQPFKVG
ncbi:MAG: AAA family ATPase, partial [Candidatus Tectomicrobia bacterium]|nr:AAA family ATPase [Candidatus Tectomicrobia bacterium]